MHKDLIDMPDEEGDNEAMHCFSKNTLKLMAKGRVFRGGRGLTQFHKINSSLRMAGGN